MATARTAASRPITIQKRALRPPFAPSASAAESGVMGAGGWLMGSNPLPRPPASGMGGLEYAWRGYDVMRPAAGLIGLTPAGALTGRPVLAPANGPNGYPPVIADGFSPPNGPSE